MTRTISTTALTVAVSALLAMATVGHAQSEASDPDVKARQDVMKTIGAQTKILGDMAKGAKPFDAEAAQAAATAMAAAAAKIPLVFEPEASDPESEALPIIWEQWADFSAKAVDLETAATTASTTLTDAASVGPALGQIGGTCKACHETYRQSK